MLPCASDIPGAEKFLRVLIILVMWALGEMAAANPDSGAFSVYTAKAYGPAAGATVGCSSWWSSRPRRSAAGLLATIFPALPVRLMAFVFIAVLTAVNLASVQNFGEFEFLVPLLKVAAIVGFLLIGVALLFGWLPAFAFGGIVLVSVAAAETAEPARSAKKAVRTVLWRILVFYIGAIFVIAAVVPVGSEGLKSRFERSWSPPACLARALPSHWWPWRHCSPPQRQPLRCFPDGVFPGRTR